MKKVNIEAPGLRIIKTVIAVLIVMLIGTFSNGILQPYEMTIVAVLAIQADVAKTFKEVKNRISATVVGGIIGTIAMAISFINTSQIVNIILIPLGIFLILYFCSKLINRSEFILIACYVFLAITLDEEPSSGWIYPIYVMANTIVASIVAMVVNLYTPRHKRNSRISVVKEK